MIGRVGETTLRRKARQGREDDGRVGRDTVMGFSLCCA
jgi:hypothetical protein